MALTEKQKLFGKEYIVDLNATQAAIRAGYSEKTARAIGAENLTKPDIQAYIKGLIDNRSKKTEISAEWVVQQLKENHELARQLGDLPPSNKALEMLGKHLGIFTEKIEHSGGININLEGDVKTWAK